MTFNIKNPAVKRLMREAQELSEPTELYYAQPLSDNLFEWHFTIRGPEASEFEGGIYHGRISLPTEYPMKPPNIMLLTPNGRFEQYRQICLSISGYHPETWRPSWSIRTALLAIIGFMPTEGAGAIGSMNVPPEERKKLAARSVNYSCDVCGPTKNLVLPLTKASSSTAQEALEMASQFTLTDPETSLNQQSEETEQPPSEGTEKQQSPPEALIDDQNPSGKPSGDTSQPNASAAAVPQPAYWLCYPVFVPATTTVLSSPPKPVAADNRPPALSFDEWLKTVDRPAPSTADQGKHGTQHQLPEDTRKSTGETSTASPIPNQVHLDESPQHDSSSPPSTSSPTTIALDAASTQPQGEKAVLVMEPPVALEAASSLPPQPVAQQARKSITQGPRIVPLVGPDRTPLNAKPDATAAVKPVEGAAPPAIEAEVAETEESIRERGQRLLRDAAGRHKLRAAVMQGRVDAGEVRLPTRTAAAGTRTSVPQSLRAAQYGALAIAMALIAVVVRRMVLMSTTI